MIKGQKVKLGIAPIAWTNDDMPELGGDNTFEQCISEMALAGYAGSEVGSKYPRDVIVLKRELAMRGLQICNAWFSTFFTERPFEDTVRDFVRHRDFLLEMGAGVIGVSEQGYGIQGKMDVPVFDGKPIFKDESWERLAAGLDAIGQLACEKGMKVCYHHHMGTGVQTADEIDRLLEMTDPAKVFLLFDSGHLVFSGENPETVLKKHVKRIVHVHLKDVRKEVLDRVRKEKMSFLQAVREGVFTVPGDGMIDFPPLFEILREAQYAGWYVVEAEQDPAMANPLQYAIRARKYIKSVTGF